MPTINAFDYREKWPYGLELFTTSTPFMPTVVSPEEIDWQIQALKDDLDRVSRLMKKALKSRPKSVFDG
jgi:hypothetical protein